MRPLAMPRITGAAQLAPLVLLAWLSGIGVARAQSPSPAPAATPGLPTVPTTRILAIGRPTSRWSPEALRGVMAERIVSNAANKRRWISQTGREDGKVGRGATESRSAWYHVPQ